MPEAIGSTIELRQFIEAVVTRVEFAGDRGDKQEAIRLLDVLRDAVNDVARKIERELEKVPR